MLAPSDSDGDAIGEPRSRRLFGRRKGPKLSARQAALVANLLPRLKVQIPKDADPKRCFAAPVDEVWLEIGFGAGEHLLWQAENHRHVGVIGAEPYESGVASLLAKLSTLENSPETISRETISRVRIHAGDAREIIDALAGQSLGRLFLLFPDPWPKNRHHKRRFIQTGTLDALARVMKPGAELRFASDDPGYVAWTLERVAAHPAFAWTAERSRDWLRRPGDWPPTRYEQKALHGPPVFLRFTRVA